MSKPLDRLIKDLCDDRTAQLRRERQNDGAPTSIPIAQAPAAVRQAIATIAKHGPPMDRALGVLKVHGFDPPARKCVCPGEEDEDTPSRKRIPFNASRRYQADKDHKIAIDRKIEAVLRLWHKAQVAALKARTPALAAAVVEKLAEDLDAV